MQIEAPPEANTGLIIVIPCCNEPDLLLTLNSLQACTPPKRKVEIIVVVNAAEYAPREILARNESTIREINDWRQKTARFGIFVLREETLPPKHAGVGLARKIGMDEAAWRFEMSGNTKGVIVCLDADSTVAPNYLTELEKYFTTYPATKAASIYFEHPLTQDDARLREGIINYELHLRYYRQALKYAGYPFHYHTIGSSMAVRSDVYQQAGGMNRRKAGEDFYFLHKIMPLGNFGEINATSVFPSGRVSERVPFGTGRAMKEWMQGDNIFLTYNFNIFMDLKVFVEQIPFFFRKNAKEPAALLKALPASVSSYLETKDFLAKAEEVNANVSGAETFVHRFFNWFDGFNALKFVHHACDNFHPDIAVENAAKNLLEQTGNASRLKGEALLDVYRKSDRQ